MPVHNALPYLDAAVESILAQSWSDFEFVILDDASTDGSTEQLRRWEKKDRRIRLIEVAQNLGPALSSDHAARAARAPLVARMDADDISYPERLQEQAELLQRHPDVGLVGCMCDIIDRKGRKIRGPETWRLARRSLFVPLAHGAIMYRKPLFERVGGYREQCVFWEDQDLIVRMSQAAKVLVIPHALYQVRQSASSTRMVSDRVDLESAVDLMYRSMAELERNKSYDEVLAAPVAEGAKIDPRVFISLGSVVLWSGRRPRLFKRFLRRADMAFNYRTISSLVWAAWASLSPGSLRAFLLLLLKARNILGSITIRPTTPVYWSLPETKPSKGQRKQAP